MGLIGVIRARSVADTMLGTRITCTLPYKYSGLDVRTVVCYTQVISREKMRDTTKLYSYYYLRMNDLST
jgi:hypothetical protein